LRVIFIVFVGLVVVVALFGGLTAIGTVMIERAHPPSGRMVEVEGGRLHVVELGAAGAPAIVLLHGASGNLEDMRFALGERLAARYRVILIDRPGHGWSDRPHGAADASPARQAALVNQALNNIGVRRAIIVGHSWSGALATAYALAYPDQVTGLVLLSPVTHPWPGGVAFINHIAAAPVLGPLFVRTFVLPAGYFLSRAGVAAVFAPQSAPPDYAARTAVALILRPPEFRANAQDLVGLKDFVTAQAPRYGEIKLPVAIISGDVTDQIVWTDLHSRSSARQMPNATLDVLPGVGHMIHYAAPELIIAAIDRLAAR
jgi:pimeloyl-ACP methyl ester carboxylesterase